MRNGFSEFGDKTQTPDRYQPSLLLYYTDTLTVWVGRGIDSMHQLHVHNVIDVYLILEHYHQTFSINPHTKYCGRECELAYRRVSLDTN
jgi:hypothetical protein